MSEEQTPAERPHTPEVQTSESDDKFFQSVREFIDHEKKYLQYPEEGAHELRYIIYRSAFNKLIGRASAYQRLLMTIKGEYDATIRLLRRRQEEEEAAQRDHLTSHSHTKTAVTCRRRNTHLRDRTLVLQQETAELQREVQRRRTSRDRQLWTPGVTVAEAEDPAALQRLLLELQAHRGALLDSRRHLVPVDRHRRLEAELQQAERLRRRLSSESERLKELHRRVSFVSDGLRSWEEQQQEEEQEEVPVEEVLLSMLRSVRQTAGDSAQLAPPPHFLSEMEDELGAHLHRFVELFVSSQYEEASLLAATTPQGVLRSLDTLDLFRGVRTPPGSSPPVLLLFQALLLSLPAGVALPSCVSLQGVLASLQHHALPLVLHAVTHNKLTLCEELGDVLTEHAQKNPGAADPCLAMACGVYRGLGLHRKASLSMCRRGLTHGAAQHLTAEDALWLLRRSSSLLLLQLLTEPRPGRPALLPVGVACAHLLVEPQHQQVALQLLDDLMGRGPDLLQEAVLGDGGSSVDDWTQVASLCSGLRRPDLSRAVTAALLEPSGTEGARCMEHVFL